MPMSTRITEPQRQLALGGKSKESKPGASGKLLSLVLDQSTKVQEPAVRAYVQKLRATHPTASPADVVAMLEKRYLATVMGSGAAVGAAAAFPGVGTLAALSATAGEAVLFLEATSLFTLALAAVHDIELAKIEHRHTLVLAVLLGEDGETTVSDVLGKERTVGGGWLAEATSTLPVPALSHLNATLLKRFTKKFAVKRGAMAAGKLLPAGIGAVIGAGGNRFIGKRIVTNARNAFGEPPTAWPVQLRLVAPDS
ncbi:hypothetical protein [Mycobacteroides abscessus]|nr:hypothetical protein [Mycobacteroides abscessus]ARQ63876.1 hypothetical protein CAK77_06975 [Mycobacteroides abscessus subsp. massiliense]MBN7326895.1 hypothetical protein [Mycobacteroides abscessus subsp. abscessus]MBN7329986.1 hypothetical protein [Mycobacteroides abscessus subsp. abscessus]MBN7425136.1 hypothetical protein [Mycobacteroides abscessus subsp. massiliense]MBN7459977.1 hypothetical protein [Mycobacteroides abscessus subsp. abscessus]